MAAILCLGVFSLDLVIGEKVYECVVLWSMDLHRDMVVCSGIPGHGLNRGRGGARGGG